MTVANTLKTLKQAAGNVKWSHANGRYTAIHGVRGMHITILPEARHYQIVTRAQAVQKELIDAKRGHLNAETKELWSRKTGQHLGPRTTRKTVEGPGK